MTFKPTNSRTFDLTANERRAARLLVRQCLINMGGDRPSDLDDDPYTWVSVDDLVGAGGWSLPAAKGTFSSLLAKGFLQDTGDGLAVSEEGYRWMDAIWD